MVGLTILIGRANAVPGFYPQPGHPTCTLTVAAPRRALATATRNCQDS